MCIRDRLCITHLPQIAAMADSHFEIEKHLQGIETITQIHVLKAVSYTHLDVYKRQHIRYMGKPWGC